VLTPFDDVEYLFILVGKVEPVTDEELLFDRLQGLLALLYRRLDVRDDFVSGRVVRDSGHDRLVEVNVFEDATHHVRAHPEVGFDLVRLLEEERESLSRVSLKKRLRISTVCSWPYRWRRPIRWSMRIGFHGRS